MSVEANNQCVFQRYRTLVTFNVVRGDEVMSGFDITRLVL